MAMPRKSVFLAFLTVTAAVTVQAADRPSTTPAEHESHHVQSAPVATPVPDQTAKVQIQRMREMHDKMMAAATPEERQALMTEYQQVMQNGMAMMQKMHAKTAKNGKSGGMMSQRNDMMSMMMTMMKDGGCMGKTMDMPAMSEPKK